MKTIKGKLIAVISLAAAIILLVGSVGSYLISNAVVSRKVQELQLEKAGETAEELNSWMSRQIAWVQENVSTYELMMRQLSYEEIEKYLAAHLSANHGTTMDAD